MIIKKAFYFVLMVAGAIAATWSLYVWIVGGYDFYGLFHHGERDDSFPLFFFITSACAAVYAWQELEYLKTPVNEKQRNIEEVNEEIVEAPKHEHSIKYNVLWGIGLVAVSVLFYNNVYRAFSYYYKTGEISYYTPKYGFIFYDTEAIIMHIGVLLLGLITSISGCFYLYKFYKQTL